jgi:hypothetical protein
MEYEIGSRWYYEDSDEPYILVEFNRYCRGGDQKDQVADVVLIGQNSGNRWTTPVLVNIDNRTEMPNITSRIFDWICGGDEFTRCKQIKIPTELDQTEFRFSTCWFNEHGTFMLSRLNEIPNGRESSIQKVAMVNLKTGVAIKHDTYEYNVDSDHDSMLVTPEFWGELTDHPLLQNLERII